MHEPTNSRLRIALAITALAIAASTPQRASASDPYRWCAVYMGGDLGGTTSCYFHTEDQCRATVSGIGGFCRQNFSYTGPDLPPQRRQMRR